MTETLIKLVMMIPIGHWDIKHNNKFREGSFKNAFNSDEPLLTKGVFWIRTYFDIENIDDDYSLVIKKGISQVDQTYVNGNLIGNSYSFIDERNYKIPNQILKKGKNLILQ